MKNESERVALRDDVERLSLVDPASGLPNRRQMAVVLERMVGAARRGEPLALVMIGLDGVGDGDGDAPSRAVREVASELREAARASDLVARYGPTEIVVALPRCTDVGARRLVLRLRERLGDEVPFTAGIAEFGRETRTAERLLEACSAALERGRRVAARPEPRVAPPTLP